MQNGNSVRRYAVFLSYRHADNKEPGRQWATWLHQVLEGYEVPADLVATANSRGELIPKSLYPVFRDEEELPADADLTRNIRQALENSGLLLVICSPRAVESKFVADEIRYFKELGKADRILALMIDGEPNASTDLGKTRLGIMPDAECLPEPLRYGVASDEGKIDWSRSTEPIAADVRLQGMPAQGWTTGSAFREALETEGRLAASEITRQVGEYERQLELAKLKVIAGALSVPLGVLRKRDTAMQLVRARQRARSLRRWLAAVAVLAGIAATGGFYAWYQRQQAISQRDLVQQRETEQKRLLHEAGVADHARAQELFGLGEWRSAMAHLARALHYDTSDRVTNAAVWHSLAYGRGDREALPEWSSLATVSNTVFSPDGRLLLIDSRGGGISFLDISTGKQVGRRIEKFKSVGGFSPDAKTVALKSTEEADTMQVFDVLSGNSVGPSLKVGGPINSAAFTPDGSAVIIGTDTVATRKWGVMDGRDLGAAIDVTSPQMVLPNTGNHVIATIGGGVMRFWRTENGASFGSPIESDFVTAHPVNDDATRALVRTKTGLQVIELSSGLVVGGPWPEGSYPLTAVLSRDGQFVATANEMGEIHVYGVGVQHFRDRTLHQPRFSTAIGFTPDSNHILISDKEKAHVFLWDFKNSLPSSDRFWVQGGLFSVVISPVASTVATAGYDGVIRLWNVSVRKPLEEQIPTPTVSTFPLLRFSSDGRAISFAEPTARQRWDVIDKKFTGSVPPDSRQNDEAVESPDGRHVFSFDASGHGQLWTAEGLQVGAAVVNQGPALIPPASAGEFFDPKGIESAAFSFDGNILATAGGDGTARLWEIPSGKSVGGPLQHPSPVRHLASSHNGRFVATFAGDRRILTQGLSNPVIRVWEVASGKLLSSPEVREKDVRDVYVTGLAFCNNDERLALLSPYVPVVFWDVATGKRDSSRFPAGAALDARGISPDGTRFVTYRDGVGQIWDAATLQKIGDSLRTPHYFKQAAWSPDGRWLATVTWDENSSLPTRGWLQLWDGFSGRAVGPPCEDINDFRDVAWSPDGRTIAVSGSDEILHMYSWNPTGALGPVIDDLFAAFGGERLTSNSGFERIPLEERVAARDRLRAMHAEKSQLVPREEAWTRLVDGLLTTTPAASP